MELASRHGFSLLENSEIPDPLGKNIPGEIYRHTFIGLVFRKTPRWQQPLVAYTPAGSHGVIGAAPEDPSIGLNLIS